MLVVGLYAVSQDQFYLLSANVSEKIIVRVGINLYCFHVKVFTVLIFTGDWGVMILGDKSYHWVKKIEEKIYIAYCLRMLSFNYQKLKVL